SAHRWRPLGDFRNANALLGRHSVERRVGRAPPKTMGYRCVQRICQTPACQEKSARSRQAPDPDVSVIDYTRRSAMVTGPFVLEGNGRICGLGNEISISGIIYLIINDYILIQPVSVVIALYRYS